VTDQPASSSGKWDDLKQRVLSAIAMVAIGVIGVWAGGFWIHALVAIAAGMMVWELVRMVDTNVPSKALWLGVVSALALFIASYAPAPVFILPLLLAPAFVGYGQVSSGKKMVAPYIAVILCAGFGLIALRDDFGILWMTWLLIVVVGTDVAGYFAGRLLGGPKFWPAISPKKTWSGTIAGWICAALIGLLFAALFNGGPHVIWVSIVVAFASQLGDIAESAIKRRTGVKDSSNLIPGHGGLLDRFDGLLGAALILVLIELIIIFPPAASL
jgi:phosphatidate cytidylyltransferase